MELGRKNLVYSMALAGSMVLFLVGYFMYMLPSLYVDHVMELNLKSIQQQHKNYVEKRSYEDVQVRNSTACYSMEIPKEGSYILITGKAFSAKLIIRDQRVYEILKRCRRKMDSLMAFGKDTLPNTEEGDAGENNPQEWPADMEEELEELAGIFRETIAGDTVLPVEIRLLGLQDLDGMYFGESVRYHYYSDDTVIMETSISDENNHYTNYIAMGQTGESFILSYLPVVAPEMDEIRPIVLQSLPMLGAVILLLVLLFSQMYSKGIVTPLAQLVRHTEEMKGAKDFSVERLSEKWPGRKDEIRTLADTLDDFYLRIKEGYQELEEENRRQEIFLRASSHQLKTPVAAALLLVDGMINEVGKYKDKERYLPEVKQQLLSMRKMVEDILYLNHCAENMQPVQVDLARLAEEKAGAYRVVLADRKISVNLVTGKEFRIHTDEAMAGQIIDNLLSNAVNYTPDGGKIEISLCHEETGQKPGNTTFQKHPSAAAAGIRIENFGVTIPEELLQHIIEPFVSGNHGRSSGGIRSHGLGLYIASYYAKKLGASLSVYNGENSVTAELLFMTIEEYKKG